MRTKRFIFACLTYLAFILRLLLLVLFIFNWGTGNMEHITGERGLLYISMVIVFCVIHYYCRKRWEECE